MNSIPVAIENALIEAGFTPTEVLVLRRLLEDDALTLRELASRTGKSVGVLDQCIKKLLRKNILRKDAINESGKYTIHSWEFVLEWLQRDMKEKRELINRQQQNFESFIKNVQQDKKRPDVQYFEGIEGLAQAYRKLLDCGSEIIGYVPVFCSIEDHPLSEFMVEWFRSRRTKNVFLRAITHDTPLGRRYHSRDPFEYRQSLLVDEEAYPFTFEKLVCGDLIVCFNYTEKRACMLRYPELAAMERSLFEGVWKYLQQKDRDAKEAITPADLDPLGKKVIPPTHPSVPLQVKTLSSLREFFLSKRSLAAIAIIAGLSAIATLALYDYTRDLQFQKMQQTVKSIATTGALQFEAKDLDALQVEADWKKPEWNKVVSILGEIRKVNPELIYVYMFRHAPNNPSQLQFISDSQSINPYANLDNNPNNNVDVNGDGKIDGSSTGSDYLAWPGQLYVAPPKGAFKAYEGLPIANDEFNEDQWGRVISGYAPVRDPNGRIAGIFAVDIRAKTLDQLTATIFEPWIYFLLIFFCFLFIRLAAFNRSLLGELWKVFQLKSVLVGTATCAAFAFLITLGIYEYMLRQTINDVGTRAMSIAVTAAPSFDSSDLDQLHVKKDMEKPAYQRVFQRLNKIRSDNPGAHIKFAIVIRGVDQDHYEFIADADSNYNLSPIGPDFNGDGVLNTADENITTGQQMRDPSHLLEGLLHPGFTKNFYSDQWGTWITGFAPIKNSNNQAIAIVSFDVDVKDIYETLHSKFVPWLWFLGSFLLICLVKFFTLFGRKIVSE